MGLFDDLLKNVDKGLKAIENGELEKKLDKFAEAVENRSKQVDATLQKAADNPSVLLKKAEGAKDSVEAKVQSVKQAGHNLGAIRQGGND